MARRDFTRHTMNASDYEGVARRGVADRQAGRGFHDNPFYFSKVPTDTAEGFDAWLMLCAAWATGWVREDAGRDQHMTSKLNERFWF